MISVNLRQTLFRFFVLLMFLLTGITLDAAGLPVETINTKALTVLPNDWRVDGEWAMKPVLTGKPSSGKDVCLRRPVLGDGYVSAELPPVSDTQGERFGLILSVPGSTITLERRKTPEGQAVFMTIKEGKKDLGEKKIAAPPGRVTLLLERKGNAVNGWVSGSDGKYRLAGGLNWPDLDSLMVVGLSGSTSGSSVSMKVESLKAGGVRPDPSKMEPWFDSKGKHCGTVKEGKAVLKFPGHTYEGDWKNGRMEGKGTYKWADGGWYQGEFRNGNFNGNGVRVWKSGNRYEGEWKEDKRDGKGVLKFTKGDSYEGEWRDDKMEGKGIYRYADGGWYQGDFKNSNFHGSAVRVWPSGDRYEGEYKDDRQSGGWYYWQDGHKTWSYRDASGEWVHEERQ